MIIKAKHHFIIYRFFKNYSIRKTNRVFEKVSIEGKFNDRGKPLLIVANHVSWWDGFWLMYLNLKVFHRKFHFMMLENQLKKYWFFNYAGGYSINKKSKTIIESLNYTEELLDDTNNMVLIFPQGKIHSMYESNIKFEKGIDRILKKTNNIEVIQVVNLVDYFSKEKPSLFIYFEEYRSNEKTISLEESFQQFYTLCVKKQSKLSI